MPSKLPEIGKFYDCYDDGKIHDSRKWEEYKEGYDWLFAKETDYFIIANSYERGEFCLSESIFVRTNDGEWFSMGDLWNSGLLIVE